MTSTTHFNPAAASRWNRRAIPVTTTRRYDDLGRVEFEETRVDGGAARAVTSAWQLGASGAWQRTLSSPTGTSWLQQSDLAGRFVGQDRQTPGGPIATDFAWVGDLYAGRAQGWGGPEPLIEEAGFDGLGQRNRWSYEALSKLPSGAPADDAWASTYCGGRYDATACGDPLMQIDLVRDVTGRVRSEARRFGHPFFDASGSRVSAAEGYVHARGWRGYQYDGQGHLITEYLHDGLDPATAIDPSGLLPHGITDADVAQAASAGGATTWSYQRQAGVGGLTAISGPGGSTRFALATPRLPGHRLDTVEVDGSVFTLGHDPGGRMTTGPGWTATYGPEDRIASATSTQSGVTEVYLHDGTGRLVATLAGDGSRKETFVHDGPRKIAAFDSTGAPRWEAAWGPGTDRLIAWRDLQAGEDYVVLTDHRRSVTGLWSAGQAKVVALAEYTALGRATLRDATEQPTCVEEGSGAICVGATGMAGMPFGFEGAWKSEVTGLIHMRARWYAPRLGEFVSVDPLLYVDTYNPYAFAAFDPINRWDPSGLATGNLASFGRESLTSGARQTLIGYLSFSAEDRTRFSRLGDHALFQTYSGMLASVGTSAAERRDRLERILGASDPPSLLQRTGAGIRAFARALGGAALDALELPDRVAAAVGDIVRGATYEAMSQDPGEPSAQSTGLARQGMENPSAGTGDRFQRVLPDAAGLATETGLKAAVVLLPLRNAAAEAAGSAARGLGGLSRAGEFGIKPYGQLRGALRGTDLPAHHLIEQRFARLFGTSRAEGLSVAVTRAEHQAFTNAWRARIPYGPRGTGAATRESVEAAAREIYAGYPEILRALGL